MINILNYIIWTARPEVFDIGLQVRWYGVLFALGFLATQTIVTYAYKKEGKPVADVEILTMYMVISAIIGARFGHILFYEPASYLANPIAILKVWEGGLASHGAALGIIIGVFLYTHYKIDTKKFSIKKNKREGQSFLYVFDKLMLGACICAALIRTGNFMNSEIIGKPTDSNYGVVFAHETRSFIEYNFEEIEHIEITKEKTQDSVTLRFTYDEAYQDKAEINTNIEKHLQFALTRYSPVNEHFTVNTAQFRLAKDNNGAYFVEYRAKPIPRHPTQLYEAGTSILLFFLLFTIWFRYKGRLPEGFIFSLFLIITFSLRFAHELFKENQVGFEDSMRLNMGQLLSIPLIITGIIILIRIIILRNKEIKV